MCTSRIAKLFVWLLALAALVVSTAAMLYTHETSGPCPLHHVSCGGVTSGKRECILHSDVCDGLPDCFLGNYNDWDEKNCTPTSCNNGAVYCAQEQKCVRADRRCDGTRDCEGGEDEQGCPADGSYTYRGVRYTADQKYACDSGKKTRWAFTLCNSLYDCDDQSDESYQQNKCSARTKKRVKYQGLVDECAPGSVHCRLLSDNQTWCLHPKKVCDAFIDCENADDENNCSQPTTVTITTAATTTATWTQARTTSSFVTASRRTTPGRREDEDLNNVTSTFNTSSTAGPDVAASTASSRGPPAPGRATVDDVGGRRGRAERRRDDGDEEEGHMSSIADSLRVVEAALICLCVAGIVMTVVVLSTRAQLLMWSWSSWRQPGGGAGGVDRAAYATSSQL